MYVEHTYTLSICEVALKSYTSMEWNTIKHIIKRLTLCLLMYSRKFVYTYAVR